MICPINSGWYGARMGRCNCNSDGDAGARSDRASNSERAKHYGRSARGRNTVTWHDDRSSTGYEVDWTGGGLAFVRWNGPYGRFTSLYPQAPSVTWSNGDVPQRDYHRNYTYSLQ